MRKTLSVLLVIIMIACFAGAISYPLLYKQQETSNEADMDTLREMRRSALDDSAAPAQNSDASETDTLSVEQTASPMSGPVDTGAAIGDSADNEEDLSVNAEPVEQQEEVYEEDLNDDASADGIQPGEDNISDSESEDGDQSDRRVRTGSVDSYDSKEKVQFSEDMILPQYREIYAVNNDLVGWICLPRTEIDYPVLQNEDNDYYLRRDFYGEDNNNGQLILDSKCDPWTPSYNLVISGHNMKNKTMFGTLAFFESKGYWRLNKVFTFDTLISEGTYVVFAAFYSADYDENEEGFRYNADIRYELDAELWLAEIDKYKLYDTGIDVEFGDEFLTLTTCTYQRENGRFVVVARKVREGEVIE